MIELILLTRGLCTCVFPGWRKSRVLELPTGTITLLFTDIEGSTLLLQQVGEQYSRVLAQCRQVLRTAFQQSHGHEVDTQGDAFFFAFARATDAVSAAVAAQRTLSSHTWPEGVEVHIRVGLHTGEPQRTAEGYVGLDVHLAARMMSVGHGGQVLLSQTTRHLVEHNLPDGVSLRDLGEHRLKDLQHPSHLFQLVIAGLPADFPPLGTLDTYPHNLPVQPTPLIGREREVAAVQQLLLREDVRLLTLTGPGGIGKTRLGLQVAAELSDHFTDGIYFVNLAPISDVELVVPTIAQTLGVKESTTRSMLEQLQAFLQEKLLLLVLDNFEQVLSAASRLSDLLARCSHLKLLVTSRAMLHLSAEHEFAVPPLALPDLKHLPDLVTLSQYEAVALFIARAQALKPDFQVSNANAPAVAAICARLDGLPLAIELAAARIKLLPPPALLARLDQRLAVLTSGVRDAPARQQTLRKTIEWSYHLLDTDEQRLFRRLSVFVGGYTLQAIEAVCAALDNQTPAVSVLDGAASLIDKSLLRQTEQEAEEPLFVMLETIREYGREALEASGEAEVTHQTHAAYYLALAEAAELAWHGPQQVVWFARLEKAHDNLRAAMNWLLERGEAEMALRLGTALWWFWYAQEHRHEGWNLLERALASSGGVAVPLRARALWAAGSLAGSLGHVERGEVLCQESLALFREIGDTQGMGDATFHLAHVAFARWDLAAARSLFEESLVFLRETGDKTLTAWALNALALVILYQGEYARVHPLAEQAVEIFREVGDITGVAISLMTVALVVFWQGDLVRAQTLAEEALARASETGITSAKALALAIGGEITLAQGETTTARLLIEKSHTLWQEVENQGMLAWMRSLLGMVLAVQGDHTAARTVYEESLLGDLAVVNIAPTLEGLAVVVAAQGETTWAVRLLAAAAALRDSLGTPLPPVYRADYERSVAAACAQLDEQTFAVAWAEGRGMTWEQALAARGPVTIPSETRPTPPAKSPPTSPFGLTVREVEVLRLLAQGLTDAQIAEQLIISPRTVNTHLKAIYGKIQVSSRSAATRYALDQHLI
jgi:predicted ATPase/class 3 adenylate cyclase/DNA-binding CsgD family transcriptional regulator